MVSYMDYTSSSTRYAFDVNSSPLFKKDDQNYINVLGIEQLNTLENTSLLDIFLSASNVVEPHYHQNAAELVYCISGAATVSILNPSTKEILKSRNYTWTGGQRSTRVTPFANPFLYNIKTHAGFLLPACVSMLSIHEQY